MLIGKGEQWSDNIKKHLNSEAKIGTYLKNMS